MSRVLTFSRVFPSYHPRRGESTYFVEKIMRGFNEDYYVWCRQQGYEISRSVNIQEALNLEDTGKFNPKYHTIRAGHRWKAGDWFSPRVWSGKPYNSKQIQFAPDIQVKKTWDFEMDVCGVCSIAKPGEQQIYTFEYGEDVDDRIAGNDGLTPEDFYWWFSRSPDFKKKKGFQGQIICWSDQIEY